MSSGRVIDTWQLIVGSDSKPKGVLLHLTILPLLVFHVLGCAVGNTGSSTSASSSYTSPVVAPAIVTQPANQSIPMGLTGTFSVAATGSSFNYQWNKNGSPIAGATASSYTTPATAFADTGAAFTVTVSNSLGTVTSNTASLTVTARAPKPGDLRFQQVGAPSTVSGYNSGLASDIPGTMGWYFSSSIGSPLYLSTGHCTTPAPAGLGCAWLFNAYGVRSQLASLGLSTGYSGGYFANYHADIQSSSWPAGGNAPAAPNSVITSLDLEPENNLFAASWIQTSQGGGFDMSEQTVAPPDLQAAATQEGVHSRVITAVSYNAGQVTYLSYGWQTDTSTIYETQVVTASLANISAAAANLAAQGYIITATGGSGLNDSFILVGTRVQGDTMARPFMNAAQGSLMEQGYATVAILLDSTGAMTFLGER